MADTTSDWLVRNVASFQIDPVGGCARDAANLPWRVKPVSELMFTLLMLKHNNIAFAAENILTKAAVDEGLSLDWHELARLDPAAVAPSVIVAMFFDRCGISYPLEKDHIFSLISTGYYKAINRFPYREIELLYFFTKIPDDARRCSPAFAAKLDDTHLIDAFNRTGFGQQLPAYRYTIDDAYSLTHALFYLTDYGVRPISELLDAANVERLRSDMLALVVIMMRLGNFDVLGELLICLIMCGFTKLPIERMLFDAGLDMMIMQVTKSGAAPPSASTKIRFLNAQAGFKDVYHTTLVTAVLFHLAKTL
jgi:hypothetical protein